MPNTTVYHTALNIADVTGPEVTLFSPTDGSSNVGAGSNIVLTFNEAVQRGSGFIRIRADSATGRVLESFDATSSGYVSLAGKVLTINPSINLAPGSRYFITFDPGTVKDMAGNSYAGTTIYDFTTAGLQDFIAPTVELFNPLPNSTGVPVNSPIVLTFSEAVQRGSGNITLLVRGETENAQVEAFDVNTSAGLKFSGNTLTIIPSSNLVSRNTYSLSFAPGSIQDAAGNAYVGSNYQFSTASETDLAPPSIISFNPPDDATNVAVGTNIRLIFNEAIQKGMGSIQLRAGSATGTVLETFNIATSGYIGIAGNILTINPSVALAEGSRYFFTLDRDAVRDTNGNAYLGSNTYDFTTDDTTAPTLSAVSPAAGAYGVAVKPSIVLTFSEPIKKGAGNITIRLDTADGAVVETLDAATSHNLTITSNALSIKPSTTLQQGKLYFVVMDNGAITDIIGNAYSGTNSYHFTTFDTAAPLISSFNPADGATGMALDGNIEITFNEPVQAGSGKIEIRKGAATGTLVEAFDVSSSMALGFSQDRLKLSINPSNNLTENSKYFVVLPNGSVKDMANNLYAGSNTYDFMTTETLAPLLLLDKNPLPGAVRVPIASNITLTFNKAVQKGAGSIELWAYGSETVFERFDIATSPRLRFSNTQLIIDPTSTLAQGITYTLVVPYGTIQDLAGNNYAIDFDYKFTTLDTIAPTLTGLSPSDGATAIATDSNITLMFNEAINFGIGTIQLRSQSATGPVVEAFNTSDASSAFIDQNILTLNPGLDLKPNALYFLVIPNGAIKDKSGNSYVGIATYDFTTAQDTAAPVVKTFKPVDGVENVPVDVGIEINFNEIILPGSGNIEIRLGSRLGPVVESFNVANSQNLQFTANMLTILPSTELKPQTHYFVNLPRGSVKDSSGNLYLGTSTYDFVTTDNAPPQMLDLTPNNGDIGVAINQPIEVVFNEAIKAGSGSVEIRLGTSPTGPLIEAVSINSSNVTIVNNMLRVNLSQPLALNSNYFVHIPAGIVQDASGNNFQGIGYHFQTNNNPAGFFYNTLADDVFAGTVANESVVYTKNSNNFHITRIGNSDNWYISGEGDDLLKNIERIKFSNKNIALDVGPDQHTGKALSFWNVLNPDLIHAPDWLGLVIGIFDAGHNMPAVFSWAINTVEALIGPVSNEFLMNWVSGNINKFVRDDKTGDLLSPVAVQNILVNLMAKNNSGDTQSKVDFLTEVAALNIVNPQVEEILLTGVEYL